jgi:hypothetical protein
MPTTSYATNLHWAKLPSFTLKITEDHADEVKDRKTEKVRIRKTMTPTKPTQRSPAKNFDRQLCDSNTRSRRKQLSRLSR